MSSRWETTKVPGIRRDKATGMLYLNKSVNGRVYGESLKTTDLAVAKQKFFARLAELASEPRPIAPKPERYSLGEILDTYAARLDAEHGSLDPKTIKRKKWTLSTIVSTWGEVPVLKTRGVGSFRSLPAKRVSYDDLLAWRKHFIDPKGGNFKPSYFNLVRDVLEEVFDLAVEFGQIRENPVCRLSVAAVPRAHYVLPTGEQWAAMLAKIDTATEVGQNCRDLLEGLSLTGLRISEAYALRVEMVDLEAREVRLPAAIVKGRNGRRNGRTIDLIPEAHALMTRLVATAGPDGLIFKAEGRRTLTRICKEAGWTAKFTLHSCRHFFATRMLESGVPVQTVAEWMGHQDGGTLLLKTYTHLCRRHGKAAAAKVTIFPGEKKDAV